MNLAQLKQAAERADQIEGEWETLQMQRLCDPQTILKLIAIAEAAQQHITQVSPYCANQTDGEMALRRAQEGIE